jgi:hypothetical protein
MSLSQTEYGVWCCLIEDVIQDVNLGTIETIDEAALALVQVLYEMLEAGHSYETFLTIRTEVLNAEPAGTRARMILAPLFVPEVNV